ncbi:hypothetical protein PG995_010263 [Apiospora arundinis]|uniref:Uncharacterized protein n=1 Tax=Apiospora arundinis TaxID=335852 RepID=A0ABR2ISQ9_9PEZI
MQLRRSVSQTFGSAHPALLHTPVPPTATREDDEKRIWRGLGLGVNDRRSSSSTTNNNNMGETGLFLQQQQHTSGSTSTTTPRAELQLRLQEQLQRLKNHTAAYNNQSSAVGNTASLPPISGQDQQPGSL